MLVIKTGVRDLSHVDLDKLLLMEATAEGNIEYLTRTGQAEGALCCGLVELHQAVTLEIAMREAVEQPEQYVLEFIPDGEEEEVFA